MHTTNKEIRPAIFVALTLAALFLVGVMLFWGDLAKAGPAYFLSSDGTASATTSPVFMTAGLSTTTEVFDAGKSLTTAADSAALLIQFTGSSTASSIVVSLEYTQGGNGLDCKALPTSCDWYADRVLVTATTTAPTMNLNTPSTYLLTFASSTVGGVAGIATRTTRIFSVATPVRYVRAVVSMPAGSLNGAVWQQFISKKTN